VEEGGEKAAMNDKKPQFSVVATMAMGDDGMRAGSGVDINHT